MESCGPGLPNYTIRCLKLLHATKRCTGGGLVVYHLRPPGINKHEKATITVPVAAHKGDKVRISCHQWVNEEVQYFLFGGDW